MNSASRIWQTLFVLCGSLPLLFGSLFLFLSYRKPRPGRVNLSGTRRFLWMFWGVSLLIAVGFAGLSRLFAESDFPEFDPLIVLEGILVLAGSGVVLGLALLFLRRSPPQQLAFRVLIVVELLILAGGFYFSVSLSFWIVFSVVFAAAGIEYAMKIMDTLPYRSARTWSERHLRIPLRRVGGGLVLGSIVFGAVQTIADTRISRLLPPMVIVLGLWLMAKSKHLTPAVPDLPGYADQTRIGALYLRAFGQEGQIFAFIPRTIGPQDPRYGPPHPRYTDKNGNRYFTFELYLESEVVKSIGPFLALGSPEDISPPPGATRLYAKDREWMNRIADLARRASCFLMDVGRSQNLRWELEYLRREGLQQKLFVLTPPEVPGAGKRSEQVLRTMLNLAYMACPEVNFRQFAEGLATMGYHLDPQADPGPGSVLTFDQDGNAVVLTRGATAPADFVNPIAARVPGSSNG